MALVRPDLGRGSRRGGRYRTMGRSHSPSAVRAAHARRSRARDPTLPRPPVRALERRRPRRCGRAALRRDRSGRGPRARRAPSGQRRPARPPDRGRRRRARRPLPPGRPNARRMALERGAPQGPAPLDLRVPAGLPGAGDVGRAVAAGLLRAPAPRAARGGWWRPTARADHVGAQGGSLQAPAGHRREHEPGRRPRRRSGWRRRSRPADLGRASARGRSDGRRRRPPSTVGDPRGRRGRRCRRGGRADGRGRPGAGRRSPTATTATRPPSATATSAG